jgi:hypothetical protein
MPSVYLYIHFILLHKMYVFSVVPVKVFSLKIVMLSFSHLIFYTNLFPCYL